MIRHLLAAVLFFALSISAAEAAKVRGAQTCEAAKVDHKIGDKTYSCTHCTNSICDDVGGQLSNCGIEHTYKDCVEKATLGGGKGTMMLPKAQRPTMKQTR